MVVTTDEVWPLVGQKSVKLPPSASMSLVVTVAMPRVRAHLKLLAYKRELSGCWPYRRWLTGTEKWLERGGDDNPTTKCFASDERGGTDVDGGYWLVASCEAVMSRLVR